MMGLGLGLVAMVVRDSDYGRQLCFSVVFFFSLMVFFLIYIWFFTVLCVYLQVYHGFRL